MFLKHFGLSVNPFGISPQLSFLFRSTALEESLAHLVYGLDNSEAIILITGPIGSGKTMAVQSFLTNLSDAYRTALVTNTQVTTVELLKLILEDLDVGVGPGWDKSDLLIAFKHLLVDASRDGQKVIVVIDEAQNLAPDVLEEVRLLTNLGQGLEQPVQLVLVGQPELKDLVNRPDLAQLRQRIRVHYEVESLDYEEMVAYIRHRMKVAGCERQVFEADALEALFGLSGGVPRLVNTCAGDALLSAYVGQHDFVSRSDVEEGVRSSGMGQDEAGAKVSVEDRSGRKARAADGPGSGGTGIQPPAPTYARHRHDSAGKRLARIGGAVVLLIVLACAAGYFLSGRDGGWARITTFASPGGGPIATGPADTAIVQTGESMAVAVSGVSAPADTIGLAPPRAEIVEPDSVAVEVADSASVADGPGTGDDDGGFYIHVASFRDRARADHFQAVLAGDGLPSRVVEEPVFGSEWNRVYVGPYVRRAYAQGKAEALRASHDILYYRIVRLGPDEGSVRFTP